jgi:peptide/nickel transport system permease protein
VYLEHVVHGDFGRSLRLNRPAISVVFEAVPRTLQVSALALGFAVVAGIPLGVAAAKLSGTIFDRLVLAVVVAAQSMPSFWVGTMLILLVAVQLGLLPTSGVETPQHLILPALTLSAYPLASITRLTRSGMLEVLIQEYVRTARAKGLGERAILQRHALRNALIPLVTFIGLEIGVLAGGAVVTETVFAVPGVGRLLVQSIFGRDYSVVQAAVVLIAGLVIVLNLIVDVLYSVLDPRVRLH